MRGREGRVTRCRRNVIEMELRTVADAEGAVAENSVTVNAMASIAVEKSGLLAIYSFNCI